MKKPRLFAVRISERPAMREALHEAVVEAGSVEEAEMIAVSRAFALGEPDVVAFVKEVKQ